MRIKNLLLILIIICNLILSGCWSSQEVNTLAIAICKGIDKSENGYILTQQVLNPKAIASKITINQAPVILYTEEGKDLLELRTKITTQNPRKIYNSHLRLIVLSEEVAREGIQDIIDLFCRGREYRTDFYFVVAKGTTANKVLSTLTPLEAVPGIAMFNSLKNSEGTWASTKSIQTIELMNSIIAEGKDPVIPGVEIINNQGTSNSIDSLKLSNQNNRLKYTSLGVFRKDKLVGWLNENESKGFNYIIGNVKSSSGYIEYEGDKISHEVTSAKSKIKAYLLDGKPAIKIEIKIVANIGALTNGLDILNEGNVEKTNRMVESKIITICESAIRKAKEDFKSDIFGFGEVIHKAYPKLWGKIKYDWDNQFVNLPVNITVNFKTNGLGELTKPITSKGAD